MIKGKWLFVFLCLCFCAFASAQSTPADTPVYTVPDIDSSLMTEQTDEEEESEKLEADTLLFSSIVLYPKDSLELLRNTKPLDKIKNLDSLLNEWQKEQLKNQPKDNNRKTLSFDVFNFFRLLLWVIVIGGVLFLIYRLFLSEKGLFAAPLRNKKITTEEEEITDTDVLAQKIKEAEKSGNYRLAVRYHYLQALAALANRNMLLLSPDKTNYQYMRELGNKPVRNEFARITLYYEYAWYGNFEINSNMYDNIQSSFKSFHSNLKN
jgi:hypothetical protein